MENNTVKYTTGDGLITFYDSDGMPYRDESYNNEEELFNIIVSYEEA